MKSKSSVDDFFKQQAFSKEGLLILRGVLRSTGLIETLKWGIPVYTYQGKNIVGIGSFKSYFGLWYYQGALLKDEKKILINAQEGKTKALRQIRFESAKDMDIDLIRSYTLEAIQNQKEGREIKAERNKEFSIALELKKILVENAELSKSFKSLTYGKQKEYSEYIANAKRENTRIKRLEKCIPMILKGVGLNDSYKKK